MNIAAFFAHPDDETMLAGGVLAYLSRLGHSVHYLVCTRGEGGEVGDPPVCDRSHLGTIRSLETEKAVFELGGKSLQFLDYIDPLVGVDNQLFSFTQDIDKLVAQLSEFLIFNKIEVIITHGSNGEYGHPAHKTVYQATKQLFFDQFFSNLFWYTVQANYVNPIKPHLINVDDPANWVLDVEFVIGMKINAARAHISQNALFVRRKTKELNRPVFLEEVIVCKESYFLAHGVSDPLFSIFNGLDCVEEQG